MNDKFIVDEFEHPNSCSASEASEDVEHPNYKNSRKRDRQIRKKEIMCKIIQSKN